MWKIFLKMGFEYLEEYLLTRLGSIPYFHGTAEMVLTMSGQVVDAYTDKDPNNKQQLLLIWENNFVSLLAVMLRGVYDVVKNPKVKERVVAILRKTLNEIDPPSAVE